MSGRHGAGLLWRAVPLRGPGDRGSGSVLLLAVTAVVLAGAAGTGTVVQATTARQRAASAADLGALAALAGGVPDCARARRVVAANGASTVRCVVAADGTVVVRAAVTPRGAAGLLGDAEASARAGRS